MTKRKIEALACSLSGQSALKGFTKDLPRFGAVNCYIVHGIRFPGFGFQTHKNRSPSVQNLFNPGFEVFQLRKPESSRIARFTRQPRKVYFPAARYRKFSVDLVNAVVDDDVDQVGRSKIGYGDQRAEIPSADYHPHQV